MTNVAVILHVCTFIDTLTLNQGEALIVELTIFFFFDLADQASWSSDLRRSKFF